MTGETASAPLIGGVGLLERAINYTHGCLRLVTPAALADPTPCAAWDLRALLAHLNDSLAALCEAAELGQVDLYARTAEDPVGAVRANARHLLSAWSGVHGDDPVSIAGCPLTTAVVISAGALEIAVHGWDVAQTCGHQRPIPPALAEELLSLGPLLVTNADRPARFAAPIPVSPLASPGQRLVAFLGRRP